MKISYFAALMLCLLVDSALAQDRTLLRILSTEAVHFIVTDPGGRRTGCDPRTGPQQEIMVGIPRTNYSFETVGDIPAPGDSVSATVSLLFEFGPIESTDTGTYNLVVIGRKLGKFDISTQLDVSKNGTSAVGEVKTTGVIEEGDTLFYSFDLKGLSETEIALRKTVDSNTLSQDVKVMRKLDWITDPAIANKYANLVSSYSAQLLQIDFYGARSTLTSILQNISSDSANTLTTDACNSLRPDVEYLLQQLPAAPPPGLVVKLVNSTGTNLTGGSLQYYDGTWKGATNNNDGTFSITTSLKTLSLRMTYEFATQTKSNVAVGHDTVAFQTVNAQVKLQNSHGAPIDTGTVQYYAGTWRNFGTTATGVASKELLPGNYSFRMTYAYGSNDKQQDIGTNPVVLFQTVNAAVQLKNSQGALMDQGTVQYYFSSWKNFGVTTRGVATKELLPGNYTFRMTYAAATNDKQQNIGTNPTVVFQTVNASVQLKNSQGNFIDQGTVQYYFSSWNNFGTTTSGLAVKELLPGNYTFRMTYESVPNDKVQNISTNSTVSFSTVLCTVSVKNSQSQPVNNALISYYSSAWKQIGPTVNGQVTKELLPANLTFRMTLGTTSQDKAQSIATSSLVEFVTQ